MEKRLVLLHPVSRHEAGTGGLLEIASYFGGFVDIVNFEFDDLDYIAQGEKPLRVGEAGEGPG